MKFQISSYRTINLEINTYYKQHGTYEINVDVLN